MRIQHLHINNFGHFADREIALPDAGLQIIYGPNEAGKTTLLEFLRGWLFDFPTRTPYDFRAGTEIAGVGTLLLADGRFVELRRRKGNKNKVSVKLDGLQTALDEAGFSALIGHANRNLFESVFAFGLEQLAQGEESLKHESLQSALFGGALGGIASLEAIERDLERQAADLFTAAARKPAINQLLGEMKELAARIKAKNLRSADYHTARETAAAAEARAGEVQQEVERLRREHSRVERLARAWAEWWELKQRQEQRAGLSAPASLPIDAGEKFAAVSQRLEDADEQRHNLAAKIAADERELAALELNPQSVSLRAEIKTALELRQSTIDARRDLPQRIHDRAAKDQDINRQLQSLRPGWRQDDLRAFAVDLATRADIDRLAAEEAAIETAGTKLRAARETTHSDLAEAEAGLAALGPRSDPAALIAVLADQPAYAADRQQLETQMAELARVERQLAAARKKLAPLLPADAAGGELPVPRVETVADFEAEWNDLVQQLRAAGDSLKIDLADQGALQADLAQDAAVRAVPSLTQRDVLRGRRDAGWDLIRRHYIAGQPAPDEEAAWLADSAESLPDAYHRAVQAADEIADQIYGNADAVARREELARQLQVSAKRMAEKQAAVDELNRQESDLRVRWRVLWQACGFEPLAPNAMRSWLVDHQAVCAAAGRCEDIAAEIERLRGRQSAFAERLRAACGQPAADVPALLAAARRAVDEANEHGRNRERLQPRLAGCDRDLAVLDEREKVWRRQWQAVLAALQLPAEWGTELARTVIERLLATRVKLDSLPDDDARIEAMQSRIAEFEGQVRPLCQRLAPELEHDPPELALEKLSQRLNQAAEAQREHHRLKQELGDLAVQLQTLDERRASLLAAQAALLAAAEATTDTEFLEVVGRARSIRAVDAEVDRLSREIELIRAGDDRDEFEQALQEFAQGELECQCRELAERLQVAEGEKREADGTAAVAREKLKQLDGSEEAGLLTQELAGRRAQLAADVDRYVPLLFARHLLAESVRRFERENQPEMILTVSRLIGEMTAGRYLEFDPMGTDRKEIILRRADGVERTPGQLSEGTRQQLYLAIRLAYVLHYCRQNEPLPIVMDDVLANFDDQRVRQTLSVLGEIAQRVQVLFFTCHPHMVALAEEAIPGLQPIELSAHSPSTT